MNNTVKLFVQYVKSRKYIVLFSILYFLIRLIRFDSYFFLKDERDLLLTALSLSQTGKDLFGHILPLVFLRISPQTPLLGMYWVVPILSFFHTVSPLVVKFFYILPTLFFPLLIFELVFSITKEREISFLTSFVVSFSPWYFHISRLGIEAHLAYFLCLCGLILYLKKKKIFGLLLLVFSYFSYFGIRPFILVAIPYIEFWNYILSTKKSWKKTAASLIITTFLFGCVYIFSSRIENTIARSTVEVIFLNKQKLSQETNFLRSVSEAPFFIRSFFDNKASIVLNSLFSNFFKGIDFSYLFSSGDYTAIYANQVTGQFFPFLFIFFILGICFLAKKKKAEYYYVAGFSFVGLISSLINSYSLTFSIRSIFSLVGLGFICSLGIVYTYELCSKKLRLFFIPSIVLIYILFSIIFGYKYLYQNYVMINGAFNEQERYVATYSKSHKIQKIIVPNIHSYFLSYISTLPSLSKKMFQMVQIELNKKDGYLLEGHRFLQCNGEQIAPVSINDIPHSSIIEESCLSTKTKLYISQYKPTNIVQLLDPEYGNSDINRDVKYYFIK